MRAAYAALSLVVLLTACAPGGDTPPRSAGPPPAPVSPAPHPTYPGEATKILS